MKKIFLKLLSFIVIFLLNYYFGFGQITRTQIINNANPYITYTWTANSCNFWNGVTCGSKTVQYAPWVNQGANIAMPYMWGGWSTQAEHNAAMSGCKSAGDINTVTSYGASLSCTSGQDCSGLVSRAWNLSSKHSTTTLPNISTSINYSQLQQGDIVNKSGDHTRLIKTYNTNGSATIIEATGTVWKVREFTYSPIQQTGYVAFCYNNVSGGCGSLVVPPSNDNCSSAITLTPSSSCNYQTFNNTNATQSIPATSPCNGFTNGNADDDVWFKFTATAGLSYTVNLLNGTGFDGVLDLRTGNCNGSSVACADQTGSSGVLNSITYTPSTNQTLYARVYHYGNGSGGSSFQICVTYAGSGSTCTAPGNVIINPTQTSASVSWSAPIGTSSTYLRWKLVSAGAYSQQNVTGMTSYTISGLTCGQNYELYMVSNCNSGGTQSTSTQYFSTSQCTSPCNSIISINGCGSSYIQNFTGTNNGAWDGNACIASALGNEQIYSFVAPTTGTYSFQIASTNNNYVDYLWKSGSCSQNGWNCIDDISNPGQIGSMSWTAGTTYYIMLDNEYHQNTNGIHSFYINCPCSVPSQPSNISGNVNVCSATQQTYSINAVPNATGYIWSYSGGGSLSGTGSSITFSPTSSGTLSVVATNNCGSSLPKTINITVTPPPNVTVSATPPTINLGQSSTLTVSPSNAQSYQWTPAGVSGYNPVVSPPITTTYNVIVSSNGCTASGSVTVNVTTTECNTSSATLDNYSNLFSSNGGSGGFNVTFTPASTACQWSVIQNNCSWITNLSPLSPQNFSSQVSYDVLPNAGIQRVCTLQIIAGVNIYDYVITQNANNGGCSTPLPAPQVTLNGECNFAAENIAGVTYQWYLNGAIIQGATNRFYSATNTGYYYVIITDANNCTGQSSDIFVNCSTSGINEINSYELTIYPNPSHGTFTVSGNLEASESIQVKLLSSLGQVVSDTYILSGQFSKEISTQNLSSGTYLLQVKSKNNIHYKKIIIY